MMDAEIVQKMAEAYTRVRKRREGNANAETWIPGPLVVEDMGVAFAVAEKEIVERCAQLAERKAREINGTYAIKTMMEFAGELRDPELYARMSEFSGDQTK